MQSVEGKWAGERQQVSLQGPIALWHSLPALGSTSPSPTPTPTPTTALAMRASGGILK